MGVWAGFWVLAIGQGLTAVDRFRRLRNSGMVGWMIGKHADRSWDCSALIPIDVGPRVRACVGSAKSTMGAEACVRRHNQSPKRQ